MDDGMVQSAVPVLLMELAMVKAIDNILVVVLRKSRWTSTVDTFVENH